MIPKTIHLIWFSTDSYPIDIKVCIDTWKRRLPDYTIKVWDMEAARAIGIPFIDEALDARKWAFAADVVRFYAVWKEGGVYMDSDIFLYRRFDDLMEMGSFVTVNELLSPNDTKAGLQAAFFMGEEGNEFCRRMVELYRSRNFSEFLALMDDKKNYSKIISPYQMLYIAEEYGYTMNDKLQQLSEITVMPTIYLLPNKHHWKRTDKTVGMHRVAGNWKKKPFLKRLEYKIKKGCFVLKYYLYSRYM